MGESGDAEVSGKNTSGETPESNLGKEGRSVRRGSASQKKMERTKKVRSIQEVRELVWSETRMQD